MLPRYGSPGTKWTQTWLGYHMLSKALPTMIVDMPEEFFDWLDRTEDQARSGHEQSRLMLARAVDALNQLRLLPAPLTMETPGG